MLDPELLQPETVRPLARREYDQLVEMGVFDDERVELLRGVLVTLSPQGDVHSGLTAWFGQRIILATQGAYEVRMHSPYAADDYSEPEPDVSVSMPDERRYQHPSKVLLLIEVADSSLRKDRRVKLPIYAGAGVPEYWIVDINARAIEVHTQPVDGTYSSVVRFERDGVLRPVAVPGVEIEVASIRWT